jgi:hypothetical protein
MVDKIAAMYKEGLDAKRIQKLTCADTELIAWVIARLDDQKRGEEKTEPEKYSFKVF